MPPGVRRRRPGHRLGAARVGAIDPLGLSTFLARAGDPQTITVLPRPVHIEQLGFWGGAGLEQTPRHSTIVADAMDFHGVERLCRRGAVQVLYRAAVNRYQGVESLDLRIEQLLGHPLGCTGAKLTTSLLYEMGRRDSRYGMVTMCVGGGMGAAGLFEVL